MIRRPTREIQPKTFFEEFLSTFSPTIFNDLITIECPLNYANDAKVDLS